MDKNSVMTNVIRYMSSITNDKRTNAIILNIDGSFASLVLLALCKCTSLNKEKIYGVITNGNNDDYDYDLIDEIIKTYKINKVVLPIFTQENVTYNLFNLNGKVGFKEGSIHNLAVRLKMSVLCTYAETKYGVYISHTTKSDIIIGNKADYYSDPVLYSPFANLYSSQLVDIANNLSIPANLRQKEDLFFVDKPFSKRYSFTTWQLEEYLETGHVKDNIATECVIKDCINNNSKINDLPF